MIWLTSDQHFGHAKLLPIRGFDAISEMNEAIVEAHNALVAPNDIVYNLGDVHLGRHSEVMPYARRLNGYKICVRGNHDGTAAKLYELGFDEVVEQTYIEANDITYWLAHIPPGPSDDGRRYVRPDARIYWGVALCGHVHHSWRYRQFGDRLCINVGIDAWDGRPVSLNQITHVARAWRIGEGIGEVTLPPPPRAAMTIDALIDSL